MLSFLQIVILAVVQGLAELLPVSSSAHVIVVERWLGLDPTTPQMTFFLVMLHTGTMFSVLLYFWKRWISLFAYWKELLWATMATMGLGFIFKLIIEKMILRGGGIEDLFGALPLIAFALISAGVVILLGSKRDREQANKKNLLMKDAVVIGLVQGICIPFRGFSRSGVTISTGLIRGLHRAFAEEFSFALAVILTPAAIVHQLHRLVQSHTEFSMELIQPGLLGMVFSFVAGLVALKWLSSWLEHGSWQRFGYYCFLFAAFVLFTHFYL